MLVLLCKGCAWSHCRSSSSASQVGPCLTDSFLPLAWEGGYDSPPRKTSTSACVKLLIVICPIKHTLANVSEHKSGSA
eukprot:1643319-Amphidinium_carterae.1